MTPRSTATPLDQPEGPVAAKSRIQALDILRGVALLGILALNIETFAGPESLHDIPMGLARPAFVGWHASLDYAIVAIKWLFFEGKMRGMFAMLFGAGVILFTQRVEQGPHPERTADLYLRRNMWLALFGLIHGTLIWFGDILLSYALCALLFLYPFRHLPARRLIAIGALVWTIGGTFGVINFLDMPNAIAQRAEVTAALAAQARGAPLRPDQTAALARDQASRKADAQALPKAVQEGRENYLAFVPRNKATYFDFISKVFLSGLILEVAGAMLLGMGLFKTGYLTGNGPPARYLAVAIIGYAISAPIVLIGLWKAGQDGFSPGATDLWVYLPYCIEQSAGVLANASLLLFVIRMGWLRGATGLLAAVGRTAFSNYIMTSLVCQFLFAWGPWKLYGALEYYQTLYVVFAIWALNLVASVIWLRFFRFGPLEWMWRSLTYWKRQPLVQSR